VLRRNLVSLREERANLQYRQTRKVGREVASDSYKKMVARFDEVFNADLADFMMQLNTHTETGLVANLGIRLDYNGYVTAAIASNNR
jgi:sorbitol-specific phosphotransferase system component IIA